jgi:hypothetical protein
VNPSGCTEKLRLLVAYEIKTSLYSASVADLSARIGFEAEKYIEVNTMAEKARRASMEARTNLEQHIADHHC